MDVIPVGYAKIDLVADTYQDLSIKSQERMHRGESSKIIVQSAKSRMPRNVSEFLNGKNKECLLQIILEVITKNRLKVLNKLKCNGLYVSLKNECVRFTIENVYKENELSSNQEEDDTKVALYCSHALNCFNDMKVIVRSPSSDTDILVIILSVLYQWLNQIYLDFVTGNHRKLLLLSDVNLSDSEKKALTGFHSFTGNDYISSFFCKSKQACWKILIKEKRFWNVFAELGKTWEI